MIKRKFHLHIKKIVSLCLLALICWLLYERNQYNLVSNEELKTIRAKLATLNPQEKKDLAHFFEYANLFCQYPYTLIDSKPMSICDFLQEADDLPEVFKESLANPKSRLFENNIERGYRIWEKYRSLFPIKKHILIGYHSSLSKGLKEIALIHTDLCLRIIKCHLDDFREILQKDCSAEEVFEILTHPENENFYKIVEHHRSLGILLGFGRNNAYLFEKNKRDQLSSFTNEWPYWPRKWRLPGFACSVSTNETKNLRKTYHRARKYVRWTYFGRNDLEVTLALLEKD